MSAGLMSVESFAEWARSKRATGVEPRKNLFNWECSLLARCSFKPKTSSDEDNECGKTNASIYAIRLNRILKSTDKNLRQMVKQRFGVRRLRDLTHSVCALYDGCLPDLGAASIYECVCAAKAFTICVVKDFGDGEADDRDAEDEQSVYESDDNLESVEEFYEAPESIFKNVFSDEEKEDEEEEEEEDEKDEESLSLGVKSFLSKAKGLEFDRDEMEIKEGGRRDRVGLISRLLACATIQRVSTHQMPGQDEWVVDLELMGVRPKYRALGIGRYLLNIILDRGFVGPFDAIVTSSDTDAVKFYEKFGFSIDPILNSKYHAIGDNWTNTTKMCFIPPYSTPKPASGNASRVIPLGESEQSIESPKEEDFESLNILELTNMESEYRQWQKLMFSAYQNQAQMFARLKKEVLMLKVKLSTKESEVEELRDENESLRRRNKLLLMEAGRSLAAADDEPDDELQSLIAQLKVLSKGQTH